MKESTHIAKWQTENPGKSIHMDHPLFYTWCQNPEPGDTSSIVASEVTCRVCIKDMSPSKRTPAQQRIIRNGKRK